MTDLDHKSKRVLADIKQNVQTASDYTDAMRAFYTWKVNGDITDTLQLVLEIRESSKQSEILEALLLSGCPSDLIEKTFAVPQDVVNWYSDLFFDLQVFKTKLAKIEYLEDYPDAWGRDLKVKAVSLGYDFVLFNFANLVPKTESQKKLVERMFMATAYKAMAMNYNSIKSEISKQAVKHAELMIKAFELLTKANAASPDANDEYGLAQFLVSAEDVKHIADELKTEEVI